MQLLWVGSPLLFPHSWNRGGTCWKRQDRNMFDTVYSIAILDYYGKERAQEGEGKSYGFVCLFVWSMKIFVIRQCTFYVWIWKHVLVPAAHCPFWRSKLTSFFFLHVCTVQNLNLLFHFLLGFSSSVLTWRGNCPCYPRYQLNWCSTPSVSYYSVLVTDYHTEVRHLPWDSSPFSLS